MNKYKDKDKCKGTGKAKGHGCNATVPFSVRNGMKVYNRKYGLCMTCLRLWYNNTDEGRIEVKKAIINATKPRAEFEKVKKTYEEETKIKTLIKYAVTVVHKKVRLRDKGLDCISCGCKWHDGFQAGHFHKAELYSNIRFNDLNINGQCVKCNIREDGNYIGYTTGLAERKGIEVVEYLQKKVDDYKINGFKWDIDELREIIARNRKEIKDLEKKQ